MGNIIYVCSVCGSWNPTLFAHLTYHRSPYLPWIEGSKVHLGIGDPQEKVDEIPKSPNTITFKAYVDLGKD